jgi:2-polyprenyl-3-methyl-5-hydroxy-6-metoxy-1,4-benzoquinol methylase
MKELSSEKIELINAYGPYNHSVWTYQGLRISNEERLSGRVEFIAKKIRECILKNFTMDEIKNMSIVDVGCYDGWILQDLSDLPFSEIVGIEPRESNITKAKTIRGLLNIKSKIKFEIGDIDTLGNQTFDIVICTGVLHHVESIPLAVHNLSSICNKMLFIETIILSSKHLTKSFAKEMEMKDIVYFNRTKRCGLTGQKFESSYYDGSTDKLKVISVPSLESLLMYLEIEGFNNIRIVVDSKSYNPIWKKGGRLANAVAICTLPSKTENVLISDEYSWIENYELGLMKTVLDRGFVVPLYKLFHFQKIDLQRPFFLLTTLFYIYSPNWLAGMFRYITKIWSKDEYTLEIIKNLRFSPKDKICLEYGKMLYNKQDYQCAISVLKNLTQKLNADWRSIYRSFYLLSQIYKEIGAIGESDRYRNLCLIANPKFPINQVEITKAKPLYI